MALDLTKTAFQIDQMVEDLRVRQSDRAQRLVNALDHVEKFNPEEFEAKRQRSGTLPFWSIPRAIEDPKSKFAPVELPDDFTVVAADGSHIDVDRHIPARCFLINIGVSELTYGSQPNANLFSQPRLYAQDDELVLRDRDAAYREQPIQGAVLGAKRGVEEIKALVESVRQLPKDTPVLALVDGSLIMFGLVQLPDFVLRDLIDEGFAKALEDLRLLAKERPLGVASYISLPGHANVVNALRLTRCPWPVADCRTNCGTIRSGERECDDTAAGLRDRDIFARLLSPGERSALFEVQSSLIDDHYEGQKIDFFYVNAGEEIGRVEVPSWVAEDEAMLSMTHSLIVDQCRRGPGYPITLMEAHEQAVVNGSDRQYFVELIENALYDEQMPVYTSEKNWSKRIRGL